MRECVSLTSGTGPLGERIWWFTKESGALPAHCSDFACPEGCECLGDCVSEVLEWGSRTDDLRRSYVVFVASCDECRESRNEVFIAGLSLGTIRTVETLLSVAVQGTFSCQSVSQGSEGQAVTRRVQEAKGEHGVRRRCLCKFKWQERVFSSLSIVSILGTTFVCQNRFQGVKPLPTIDWWRGVTDTVDRVSNGCHGWLVCVGA